MPNIAALITVAAVTMEVQLHTTMIHSIESSNKLTVMAM